jgi:hypothetical protein
MDEKGSGELSPDEILANGKKVYDLLHAWAESHTLLVYSTGLFGFRVEGKLQPLQKAEDDSWGVLDASFLFASRTREVTAQFPVMPGMKVVSEHSKTAVAFGPGENYRLRPALEQGPRPDQLEQVLAQFRSWIDRGTKLHVHLEFDFASIAAPCTIEALNEHCFALKAEGSGRTFFAFPTLSRRALVGTIEGSTMVELLSADRSSRLCILEPGPSPDSWMTARMGSDRLQ